jgi:DNA-binding GntR family transcriptional regulator
MTRSLKLERPKLLTDLAASKIREAVVKGEFKLGERLSEAQVAEKLGTSKTPVREALVRLKVEGLVDVHPQSGSFVFRLTDNEVSRLCTFREMLEIAALREAAAINREGLLKGMKKLLIAMTTAESRGDVKALADIDMDFHYLFLECANNTYLISAYNLIRYQLLALRHRSPIEKCVENHQVLHDAIEKGDVETACALLEKHIKNTEPRYCNACKVA